MKDLALILGCAFALAVLHRQWGLGPAFKSANLNGLRRAPRRLLHACVALSVGSLCGWVGQGLDYGWDRTLDAMRGRASIEEVVACRWEAKRGAKQCAMGGQIIEDASGRKRCTRHGLIP